MTASNINATTWAQQCQKASPDQSMCSMYPIEIANTVTKYNNTCLGGYCFIIKYIISHTVAAIDQKEIPPLKK